MAANAGEKGKSSGKERLIRAAQSLAQERSFDDITIEDIIKVAELSRPAFYYHFAGGKDDLLTGIVKHYSPHSTLRPVVEQIEQELQQGVPLDDETILRRLAGAFYDGFITQGDHTRLAILLIHTHPEAAQILADRIVKGRRSIIEYIEKRQEAGHFCKQVDPGLFFQVLATTFAMRAVCQGLNDLLPFAHLSRDEVVDQVVSMLLYGIVKR